MVDDKLFSIIDFGSSKLRLGVYANYLPNSKFISEEDCFYTAKSIVVEDNLKKIILRTEKEIGKHLKNIDVMLDNKECFSVDISIKKKIDNDKIENNLIKNFIREAKILIESNNIKFKIQHIIITNYNIDGKDYKYLPNVSFVKNLVVELKFLLIPFSIIQNIKNTFKKNHISINNILNSSYVKSSHYLKYFKNYNTKVFLDIGLNKTSLFIYSGYDLIFFNFIPIGGNNITKDISKILNIDIIKSEELKKELKQNNLTFLNNEDTKDLLIKIIHARIEEIIDLSFQNFKNYDILKNSKSILIFTGEGSKILSKNSIYLKEEYDYFDDMNFFEENKIIVCDSAYNYSTSDQINEVVFVPKKQKNRGFFERMFYLISK